MTPSSSRRPRHVGELPGATSILWSWWANTGMLEMWVCSAQLPQSTNIIPNSRPATCSYTLSSMRASPPSRLLVRLEKILIGPRYSCTRFRGHSSWEWVHT